MSNKKPRVRLAGAGFLRFLNASGGVAVALDLFVEDVDVPATHRQDEVARLPVRAQVCLRVVKSGRVVNVLPRGGEGSTSMRLLMSPGSFSRAAQVSVMRISSAASQQWI